jgi:TPR repeat protein
MGKMTSVWDNEPDLDELRQAYQLIDTAHQQAMEKLESLAARGSPMSMMYIADAYRTGKGTKIDLVRAEEWYRRASENGMVLGTYELARIYLDAKRYEQAKEAFDIGASKKYLPSINMLGTMYRDGLGVDRDLKRARDCFERATAGGHVFSKRNLGVLLMRGKFGVFQAMRGLVLFIASIRDLVIVGSSDSFSDRLR